MMRGSGTKFFFALFIFIILGVVTYHALKHRSRINMAKTNFPFLLEQQTLQAPETDQIIPKIVHQTYFDKALIPEKIYNNIRVYASSYEHKVYDDDDIRAFLRKHFKADVLNAFNNLKLGAHKADLFRYCVLYVEGGVYLDIKTELLMDLEDIIEGNRLTTVIDRTQWCIYQGVIAASKHCPIFLTLIDGILKSGNNPPYNLFIREFYRYIQWDTKNENKILQSKKLLGERQNYSLFKEVCSSSDASLCSDGFDKYGLCCNIFFKDRRVIKTRYADYPWTYKQRNLNTP